MKGAKNLSSNIGLNLAAIILIVSSVVRLGSSFSIPALPSIGSDLDLSLNQLNSTLTLFFAAFGISTLVVGPIIDSYGRSLVIRYGLIVFIVGSLIASIAVEINLLLIGRVLQAIGAGVIPVSGRVMIRDAYDDNQVISILGWIAALGSLIPMIAPTIGGFIVVWMGWRATFYILAILSALVVFSFWKKLPETLVNKSPFNLKNTFVVYKEIIISGSFTLVILPLTLCFIIQGAYFAAAPHIFVSIFGLKPSVFGLSNIVLVLALLIGRTISSVLAKKVNIYFIYLFNSILPILSGLSMIILIETESMGTITFLAAGSLFALGFGGLMPIGTKSILTAWRNQGGMASALFGCCTIGAMSIGSGLLSLLGADINNSISNFAYLTTILGILIAIITFFTKKQLV